MKKIPALLIIPLLILADMWPVNKRYLNDDDFKRRFFFWQKKHDSVNETDSQNEKKENVPAATKVSKTDEARLLQEKSMEIIKQKLKAQCTNPK